MAFTIEVNRKGKDEQFGFFDLKLFHQECFGGRLKIESYGSDSYSLKCERCGMSYLVDKREEGTTAIIGTAIDGEKREVRVHTPEYTTPRIASVIQRAETQ